MTKETAYLAPDVLLRLLLTKDTEWFDLYKKQSKVNICTSALSFWEAISCLTEKEIMLNASNICELLQSIAIVDYKQTTGKLQVQSIERRNHLRKVASQ